VKIMLNAVTNRMSVQERDARGSNERVRFRKTAISTFRMILFLATPAALVAFHNRMQPWISMWLLAASIFAICKAQSWLTAGEFARRATWKRNAAYLFLWPGLNAAQFLDSTIRVPRPATHEGISAAAKTFFGAAIIWLGVRFIASPLLAAWAGMLGLILVLHFGIFHLLSLIWRTAGVSAQPIMRHPLQSESLSEFWGKRWNLGFRQISHDWIFAPLRKRVGMTAATLGAFLASGLIHDLVISVPAGAGYGLPTVYFLLQGFGVLAERSTLGAEFGLSRGASGWLWMALFTAAPAYFLFHPWFAMRVMIPFLRVIGAGC